MARIGWVEGVGYLASLLVFCTFYMKTMIPLRYVAIASNIVFMTYGLAGVFAPDNRRTGTAVCESDVEIGAITDAKVLQLYYQNPTFGFYMFRLVLQRMLENERRQQALPG